MIEDIYDPLDEYANVFRDKFAAVAKDTFAQLAAEAHVDVQANRDTCRQLYATEAQLSSVKSTIGWTTFLCVALWAVVIGGGMALFTSYADLESAACGLIVIGMVLALVLLLAWVPPPAAAAQGPARPAAADG